MNNLGEVLEFVAVKHAGQVDKAGKPYLGHLLRVAARVCNDPLDMLVALLHDVVEDCEVSYEGLNGLVSTEVILAVALLTRDQHKSYDQNIVTIWCADNQRAIRVKLADLEDNMDPNRPLPKELEYMRDRYAWAYRYLKTGNF